MAERRKSPYEFTIEDLDRELIARGVQFENDKPSKKNNGLKHHLEETVFREIDKQYSTSLPLNPELSHVGTEDIGKVIIYKSRSDIPFTRGPWSKNLLDCYQVKIETVHRNFDSVSTICRARDLQEAGPGFSQLLCLPYREALNLSVHEPFRNQPVTFGKIRTGFLVAEDIIATTGQFIDEKDLDGLRFVFGYRMMDETRAVTRFSNDDIYQGVQILHKQYNENNENRENWALIKLDRRVPDRAPITPYTGDLVPTQEIYVIGHPMGLPAKLAKSPSVKEIVGNHMFRANLDVYSGNPGSPVFDRRSDRVIGMVLHTETGGDFRRIGDHLISIIYPEGRDADCNRVSLFLEYLK